MTTISFQLKPGLTDETQDDVLNRIGKLEGVSKATHLLPGSTDPVVRRMGTAYIRPGADPAAVLRHIKDLPEVESAEVPPLRYLV